MSMHHKKNFQQTLSLNLMVCLTATEDLQSEMDTNHLGKFALTVARAAAMKRKH